MNVKINNKQKSDNRTIEEQTSDNRRLTKIISWRTAWQSLLTKFFADKNFLLYSRLVRHQTAQHMLSCNKTFLHGVELREVEVQILNADCPPQASTCTVCLFFDSWLKPGEGPISSVTRCFTIFGQPSNKTLWWRGGGGGGGVSGGVVYRVALSVRKVAGSIPDNQRLFTSAHVRRLLLPVWPPALNKMPLLLRLLIRGKWDCFSCSNWSSMTWSHLSDKKYVGACLVCPFFTPARSHHRLDSNEIWLCNKDSSRGDRFIGA